MMTPTMAEPYFWYEHLTSWQIALLAGWPIGAFLLIIFALRVVWKPKASPKFKLPTHGTPNYGAVDTSETDDSTRIDILHAGHVAGAYDAHWTETFDLVFLIFMAVLLVILSVVTSVTNPGLWMNHVFWLYLIPKLVAMMLVSFIGGIICRHFCLVNETGYVMTTVSSAFKVNYTRKLQHFAAYFVPLVVKAPSSCNCSGPLELAWGDFVTMIGFLFLTKPIRERFTFFMLQFNSLDRPEDRPHTLKWIVAGNIVPGLALLLFFRWLFAATSQQNLVFIIVFITGIGDGLAEPVGITFGKHKYCTRSCFSRRKYSRSLEGSACVFVSGLVFPALQYYDFQSSTQLWAAMAILPPVIAYAEATAPHTMDTPVLMTLTGMILYGIITFLS